MTHPILLVRNDDVPKDFPLILIVGREPNNETYSDGSISNLPFDKDGNQKCAFWNIAFKILGISESLSSHDVKKVIQEKGFCPLIFTDALPKGIPNAIKNKYKQRELLSQDGVQNKLHVEQLFNHYKIMSQVKLVLYCGLEHSCFNPFKSEFEKRNELYNYKIISIPFLFGNFYPKIKEELNNTNTIEIIANIFNEFKNYPTVR